MSEQNYANHARLVAGFHMLLGSFLVIGTISSLINLWQQWAAKDQVFNAILITLLFICGILLFWYTREFPIKAQDRAIRAEENLRYFVLTRKPLDSRITIPRLSPYVSHLMMNSSSLPTGPSMKISHPMK